MELRFTFKAERFTHKVRASDGDFNDGDASIGSQRPAVPTSGDEPQYFADHKRFRIAIGNLQRMAAIRPDIQFAIKESSSQLKASKQIELRYLHLQGLVKSGVITEHKIGTQNNPSDIVTKFMPQSTLSKHFRKVGLAEIDIGEVSIQHLRVKPRKRMEDDSAPVSSQETPESTCHVHFTENGLQDLKSIVSGVVSVAYQEHSSGTHVIASSVCGCSHPVCGSHSQWSAIDHRVKMSEENHHTHQVQWLRSKDHRGPKAPLTVFMLG
eukprot:2156641-Amphidinium_carterae.1